MKKSILFCCFVFLATSIFAQEALKSAEEEYYDFLVLSGIVERPTIGYRTLSDNVYELSEENINSEKNVWKNNNLGNTITIWNNESPLDNGFLNGLNQSFFLKIYGPEWYNSYNTGYPFGQNDGALWQGKGYNTSLTGGIRAEIYGFELTLKPQISFSENKAFELMDNSSYYTNKYAYTWGYGGNKGVDAPQRFGDSSIFKYDWNDSEIRWSWKTFTIGFGTQPFWTGPAWLNPLLQSNNAPSYPKFDFGIRNTKIYIPFTDFYIGDIELRMFIGKTSESKYFDDDVTNNHNLINGYNFTYSPFFLKGLSIGFNKICLTKWDNDEIVKYLYPFYNTNDQEDQKLSLTFDWVFPQIGLELFGELGLDDYILGFHSKWGLVSIFRNPFHTMTYTFGFKKTTTISKNKNVYGELIFEWNNTEMSLDFQFEWPYNFGFHHLITQGFTNEGQWLGSGIGYGGNSQIIAYNIFYPKGNTLIFVSRNNPDNNYIYSKTITTTNSNKDVYHRYYIAYKANFNIGFTTNYFVTPSLSFQGGCIYNMVINPNYNPSKSEKYANYKDFNFVPDLIHNINLQFGIKYNF